MKKGAEGKNLEIIKAMLANGESPEEVSKARDVDLDFVKGLVPRKIKKTATRKKATK